MSDTTKHDYLKRLPSRAYEGYAYVHWTMTIKDRATGWLTALFHHQFRELFTHTAFRYGFCCPMYSLLPDHLHLLCIGWRADADQRRGIRFLRKHLNRILAGSGVPLQKQPYDNVLRAKDREREAFARVAWYIRANPLRAGLVAREENLSSYAFSGCLVPGYPELDIHADDYWRRFWRVYQYLCEGAREKRVP